MTMTFSLLLCSVLYFLATIVSTTAQPTSDVQSKQVSFGNLRFQISSEAKSEARIIIADLVARTSEFLDTQLAEYFSETISAEYFSHTGLGVLHFALEDEEISTNSTTDPASSSATAAESVILNQYVAMIEFEGILNFNSVPLPGSKFLEERIKTVFQSTNARREFVAHLQFSDSLFLNSIQHMIVFLNDRVIASEDLSHYLAPSDYPNNENDNDDLNLLLIVGCSAGGAVVCVLLALCCCCCCASRKSDNDESQNTSKTSSKTSHRIKEVRTAEEEEDDGSSQGAPSIEPSLISQESSLFTYNPRHDYTYGPTSASPNRPMVPVLDNTTMASDAETGTLPSNFSTTIDLNIEAWTKQNTLQPDAETTIPFGNDISAIVPDKSVMVEPSDNNNNNNNGAGKSSSNSKLTQKSLNDFDGYNIGWKAVKNSQQRHQAAFMEDSFYSVEHDSSIAVSDASSDVISDLNNLSRMIKKQRGSDNSTPPKHEELTKKNPKRSINTNRYLYGPRDDD